MDVYSVELQGLIHRTELMSGAKEGVIQQDLLEVESWSGWGVLSKCKR